MMNVRTVVLGVLAGLIILSPDVHSRPQWSRNTEVRDTESVQGRWTFDDKPVKSVALAFEYPGALVQVFLYKVIRPPVTNYKITLKRGFPVKKLPTSWTLWCNGNLKLDGVRDIDWSSTRRYTMSFDSQHCNEYTIQPYFGGLDLPEGDTPNVPTNGVPSYAINQLRIQTKVPGKPAEWYPGTTVET